MDVLEPLAGACDATTGVDVVFVHGAESDARSCWHPRRHPELSVPERLVRELPYVCAWSLGYNSSVHRFRGHTLPLAEQSIQSARELANRAIGRRPVVFIAHSVGGLLVKHVLRLAEQSGDDDWKRISWRTAGVVFLATPHFGTHLPRLARWLPRITLVSPVLLGDLRDHEGLAALNDDFLRLVAARRIRVDAFYETRASPDLLWCAPKVSRESADPRVPGLVPTAVNASHENVCKPTTQNNHVFVALSRFVRRCFAGPPRDVFVSYAREDAPAADALVAALRARTGGGGPTLWSDRLIRTGKAWETEIFRHMESSRAAVLLVTPAFLESAYIRDVELPFLQRRSHVEGMDLIYVSCDPGIDVVGGMVAQRAPDGGCTGGMGSVQWAAGAGRAVHEMSCDERDAFFARVAARVPRARARRSEPGVGHAPLTGRAGVALRRGSGGRRRRWPCRCSAGGRPFPARRPGPRAPLAGPARRAQHGRAAGPSGTGGTLPGLRAAPSGGAGCRRRARILCATVPRPGRARRAGARQRREHRTGH